MAKQTKNEKKFSSDEKKNKGEQNDSEWLEFVAAVDQIDEKEVAKKISSESFSEQKSFKPKTNKHNKISIDLHGKTLEQAKSFLSRELESVLNEHSSVEVNIITGKGRHSENGKGVLVHEIYSFVQKKFGSRLKFLDSDPSEAVVEGRPIRGHFRVKKI